MKFWPQNLWLRGPEPFDGVIGSGRITMLENEPGTGAEGGLKRWLEGFGLSHYTDLFAQHRLDLDVMADLTESDLVELGLPLGDRKRLQRAMTRRSWS